MYLENQLAAIGGVTFSDKIETAGINEEGMLVNPIFYGTLNQIEKQFLIEHELLHLILKHHTRFENNTLTNIACDLAINSMLQERYCGSDDPMKVIPRLFKGGCFPSKNGLPEGKTADWYLEMLMKGSSSVSSSFGGKLDKNLADKEESIEEMKESDDGFSVDSDFDSQVKVYQKKDKYSFEQFVRALVGGKSYRNDYGYVERLGRNRRALGTLMASDVLTEGEVLSRKNRVLLFLDFSQSCEEMVNDFLTASNCIPKGLFDVVRYKFGRIPVPYDSGEDCESGWTCFNPLPVKAAEHKYDMVWVFTDGVAPKPSIADPNKWHWFLDGQYLTRYIPEGCHIHFLPQLKKNK